MIKRLGIINFDSVLCKQMDRTIWNLFRNSYLEIRIVIKLIKNDDFVETSAADVVIVYKRKTSSRYDTKN